MRRHGREMAVGFVLGLAGLALFAALDERQRVVLAGLLLAGIGTAYVAFAVADGRATAIAVQTAGAAGFLAIAYVGIQQSSPVLLGVGFLAHALWDAIHHDLRGPTRVRPWYPPFCAVADVVLGLPLVTGWL